REIIGSIRPRQTPWWQAPAKRQQLLALAAQGTPAYIYDLDKVRERARQLKAISAIDRRYYAIKANSHPEILRTLAAEGFGLECVSQGEVELVFASVPDMPAERVLFTPSFAPISEYEAVL